MDIIKSSTDISYLFAHGKRYRASSITLLVIQGREQHDPSGRVAFIAGKKSGNAVWRNAAKRRMRSISREIGAPWPGFDVVFLARPSIMEREYRAVLEDCRRLSKRFLSESREQHGQVHGKA